VAEETEVRLEGHVFHLIVGVERLAEEEEKMSICMNRLSIKTFIRNVQKL